MAHRVGIIGLGVMGQRMLGSMGAHAGFTAVAGWDPARAAGERVRELAPGLRLAASAEALIADPAIDCVYIAAPPASHPAYAELAFDHGKPVFCEKPLTVDLAAARRLVERVEGEGRRAAINFPFASSPAAVTIAEAVAGGELGALQRIEIEVAFAEWPREWQKPAASWLARREEGGFVREVVSHFLFLARRVGGPLRVLEAAVAYPPDGVSAETGIEARLMAGDVAVELRGSVGRIAAVDENRFVATGAAGALRLHDWVNLSRREGASWQQVDLGAEPLRQRGARAQLDALAAMIEGRPHNLPTFREGLEVQEAVEALLEDRA